MFGVKDHIPGGLRSRVVYKFVCEGCRTHYVSETVRHFCIRVKQHLASHKASRVCTHLQNSEHCRALWSANCFLLLITPQLFFN